MSMLQHSPPVPDGTIALSRAMPGPGLAEDGIPEDGCTVPRPPLRAADPSLWAVLAILAASTAWLLGNL